MDIMKRVAAVTDWSVSFMRNLAGVNGSGKHLNWSISDDKGNNLQSYDTPKRIYSSTVLTAVIHAVYTHSDLLRHLLLPETNIVSVNEAPPAIVSVFSANS